MDVIRVSHLWVRSGKFELRDISFEIPAGHYGVLMGRTGCGKTTLLEAICGLRSVLGGRIELNGRDVTHLKPGERGIGYVPQDRALFSTMTVAENLGFSLRVRGWTDFQREERIDELAELLDIAPLLERMPANLSGGEQQRVALGRALAPRPVLLILDEPLSALDDETRGQMHAMLAAVRASAAVTALHVTHHREDAERLADLLLQMRDGRIEKDSLHLPTTAEKK